jgi:hypothetical protein
MQDGLHEWGAYRWGDGNECAEDNRLPDRLAMIKSNIFFYCFIMKGEEELRKKRSQKRGSQVPMQELGFKAKVYLGVETEYTRRRVRYKVAK